MNARSLSLAAATLLVLFTGATLLAGQEAAEGRGALFGGWRLNREQSRGGEPATERPLAMKAADTAHRVKVVTEEEAAAHRVKAVTEGEAASAGAASAVAAAAAAESIRRKCSRRGISCAS
jgi:hypothetical protein